MDLWATVGVASSKTKISFEKLKNSLENSNRPQEQLPKNPKYKIKEKDYDTYNYLSHDNSEENTLLKIIQRGVERKEIRKSNLERYQTEQLKKEKEKIELEKMRCAEEKRKHNERLTLIKENYLSKKLRDENLQRFEKKMRHLQDVAISHHNDSLLRQYFRKLKKLVLVQEEKAFIASEHFKWTLLKKTFNNLKIYSYNSRETKTELVQKFYEAKIQHYIFKILAEAVNLAKEKQDKAKEFDDLRTLRIYFQSLKISTQDSLLTTRDKTEVAKNHYNRVLKTKSLSKWRMWMDHRQKFSKDRGIGLRLRSVVKNILPDFTPPSSTDDEDDDSHDEDRVSKFDDRLWRSRISTYLS